MSKLNIQDLAANKDTINSGGDVRFHIIHSRTGLTTKCHLWHPDGRILGSASGGGYDKAGVALGQAIEVLFGEELKALTPAGEWYGEDGGREYRKLPDGLYGLTRATDGHMILDGACGIECMFKVLCALGFADVTRYSTGKLSDMVLASGRK